MKFEYMMVVYEKTRTSSILGIAASAAVFCTQPHVIVLKYGEILGKTYFGFPAE